MKRVLSIVALVAALTLGTGASALAHTITVESNDVTHDLATGTPRIFNSDYEVIAKPADEQRTYRSAASHGTNTACKAIPEHAAVTITGGTCGSN